MYDVVIIGFGPVGATLANFLGQGGWRVAVVETDTEVFPIPRAVHCDDEAQRIWQAANVLELVEESFGGYPPDRQYINARGRVYFETHLSPAKPFGFQTHMYFHQPMLEAGLRAGVARHANVELFLGASAVGIEQDAERVTVEIEHVDSAETQTLHARVLVGCDGARSFVRKSAEIRLGDLQFDQPWLVTDFYLKEGLTREDVGFPYAHQQICDPAQPISYIPNGKNNFYRFEFMLPAGVTKAQAEETAYVEEKLSAVVDLDKIDLVRATVYTFHALVAEHWRRDRIFIAGDAAHQMPPFAGQGMCSGLRDAHNLAWKLNLVLAGSAGGDLLDSYQSERKPHVTRMTRGTMFLGNLVQTQSPLRAIVRDLLFGTLFKIPAIFGRIANYALRAPALTTYLSGGKNKKVIGTYFPQPKITDSDGKIRLLDDVLGNGFAVLGLAQHPASHFADLRNLPIRYIEILPVGTPEQHDQILDHTDTLAKWCLEHQADFIILRPDRFVFGAYTHVDIETAQEELIEQLSLHTVP